MNPETPPTLIEVYHISKLVPEIAWTVKKVNEYSDKMVNYSEYRDALLEELWNLLPEDYDAENLTDEQCIELKSFLDDDDHAEILDSLVDYELMIECKEAGDLKGVEVL
jgi:hypothetical protein